LLRKIDENQSRNLFFVTQHFDEKNNLLNNLRHIKKRKIKNIKQATSVLKKSVCYPTKIMTLTYILRCQKKKKLVKLKEDKKSTSKSKNFQPGIDVNVTS